MRSRYQAGRHEARVSGLHSHTREYTVRFYVGGVYQPAADYFTSDREDAHGTARAEIARLRLVDLVTPATVEHERRKSAPYWTGTNWSYPGCAGRWIGNTWYHAHHRQHAREAMGNIMRETLYKLRPDQEPDIAPNWAVF